MGETSRNILIHGSCVSRDAFGTFGSGYKLLHYVARQSLISAMSPGTKLLSGEGALESSFQTRNLVGDLTSNLMRTVRRHAADTDVFLLDLTDERVGVLKLPDGSYITRSHELVSSGLLATLPQTPARVEFGTERHFTLWSAAADRFFGMLASNGLLQRTLALNTPWATHSTSGELLAEFRVPTATANAVYPRYFDHLKSLGVRVFDLPAEASVSPADHQWGPSPYHFGPAAAQSIHAAVDAVLAERSAQPVPGT